MRFLRGSLLLAVVLATAPAATAQTADSVLSLDSLLNLKISTAAKYEQTEDEAAASISVVTAADIERFGLETLGEVLSMLTGFYTSYDLNYTYVGVRGFSRPTDYNNRLLLLIDGQQINEPEFGSAPFGNEFPLPMSAIERIEVVRGPGSVLYGTGAMFAVVNVITKRAQQGTRVAASLDAGSHQRRGATAAAYHRFNSGSSLDVTVQRQDSRGRHWYFSEFDTGGQSDGVARGLDGEASYSAFAAYRQRDFQLSARLFERRKDVPTASWGADFNAEDTYSIDARQAIGVSLRRGVNASTEMFLGAAYEHFTYEGSYPSGGDWTDATDAKWAKAEAGLLWDANERNRVVAGLDLTHVFHTDYRYYEEGAEMAHFGEPHWVAGLYAQLETRFGDAVTSILGISRDERSAGEAFTSPRVALVFAPRSNTTVKALYGRAFRAPNPYELHSDSALAGRTGTAPLDVEKIDTRELVIEQRIGQVGLLKASVYHNHVRNVIDYVVQPDTELGAGYENAGSVKAAGAEVLFRVQDWYGQSGHLSVSYQHARDGANAELTNTPELFVKAGWSTWVAQTVSTGILMEHETRRLTLSGGETPGFTRFDLALKTRPVRSFLAASLRIRNLLDTDYAYPAGAEHRQRIIPQDGRTFILRLEANWQ